MYQNPSKGSASNRSADIPSGDRPIPTNSDQIKPKSHEPASQERRALLGLLEISFAPSLRLPDFPLRASVSLCEKFKERPMNAPKSRLIGPNRNQPHGSPSDFSSRISFGLRFSAFGLPSVPRCLHGSKSPSNKHPTARIISIGYYRVQISQIKLQNSHGIVSCNIATLSSN